MKNLRIFTSVLFVLFLAMMQTAPILAGNNHKTHDNIVGGIRPGQGEIPYIVGILDKRWGDQPYNKQFCDGSLIDFDLVLTAAHCVLGRETDHPENLRVVIGRYKLNSQNQGQTCNVKRLWVYNDYHDSTDNNDVAVLQLDCVVDTSLYPPVNLPPPGDTTYEVPGTLLTASGWGVRREMDRGKAPKHPKASHVLRSVEVPVIDDTTCNKWYGTKFSQEVTICAGEKGLDTCYGDSGGPLVAPGPVQVGIVSWGAGCARKDRPGIYTRVADPDIRDFIERTRANAHTANTTNITRLFVFIPGGSIPLGPFFTPQLLS